MPRFVVLKHDGPGGVHWDFMLEVEGTLWTWSLPTAPAMGTVVVCQRLDDHRLEYLEYEGPVSGDRGNVTRWDRGSYRFENRTDTQFAVELQGDKLIGRATLKQSSSEPRQWELSLQRPQNETQDG